MKDRRCSNLTRSFQPDIGARLTLGRGSDIIKMTETVYSGYRLFFRMWVMHIRILDNLRNGQYSHHRQAACIASSLPSCDSVRAGESSGSGLLLIPREIKLHLPEMHVPWKKAVTIFIAAAMIGGLCGSSMAPSAYSATPVPQAQVVMLSREEASSYLPDRYYESMERTAPETNMTAGEEEEMELPPSLPAAHEVITGTSPAGMPWFYGSGGSYYMPHGSAEEVSPPGTGAAPVITATAPVSVTIPVTVSAAITPGQAVTQTVEISGTGMIAAEQELVSVDFTRMTVDEQATYLRDLVIQQAGGDESAWKTGAGELNLVGIRSFEGGKAVLPEGDVYDDTLCAVWVDADGITHLESFTSSTDAGIRDSQEAAGLGGYDNEGNWGSSHLADGFYEDTWVRGSVPAGLDAQGKPVRTDGLVQTGDIRYHIDSNNDGIIQEEERLGENGEGRTATAWWSILFHPGGTGDTVGEWSFGCQVIKKGEYSRFKEIVGNATNRKFSYLLIDSSELPGVPASSAQSAETEEPAPSWPRGPHRYGEYEPY